MADAPPTVEGLRERKRRETAQRIADAGMRLFIANGYEATTLDAIAAEAGISRRTFFYYFQSKDDILLTMQSSIGDMVSAALQNEPLEKPPLEATRDAFIAICARFPPEDMLVIDRIMRSSEAVLARKQASYVQQEKALFAALRERCPEPERETGLRLIAMAAIGAVRLAQEKFSLEAGKRPFVDLVRETFDALRTEVAP